jgi:hypothetical protein
MVATGPFVSHEMMLRFTLLTLVLFLLRGWRLPPALDVVVGAGMLLATWAGAARWYDRLDWLAPVVHFAIPGLIAGAVVNAMILGDILALNFLTRLRTGVAMACLAAVFGLAAASSWEIYEWLANELLWSGAISISYADTMADIASGGAGAALAGLVLTWLTTSGRPRQCG